MFEDGKDLASLQAVVDQTWQTLQDTGSYHTLEVLGNLCMDGEFPTRQEYRTLIMQACILVACECRLREKQRQEELA